MFRWPGKIPPADHEAPINSIDIVPTILAAVDVDRPAELPGVNLLPLIADGEPLDRGPLFGSIFDHDVPDLDDPAQGLQYRWCVDGRWKLIVPADDQSPELYDLEADPHEMHNVAADHPQQVKRLAQLIDDWWNP